MSCAKVHSTAVATDGSTCTTARVIRFAPVDAAIVVFWLGDGVDELVAPRKSR